MSKLTRRDFLKLSGLAAASLALTTLRAKAPQSQTRKPNIVILLADTMTAANLSLFGYPRQTTPNLERLAGRATVYHSHYSGGNFTTSGTATILTGSYPWTHRAVNLGGLVRRQLADHNIFHLLGDHLGSTSFAVDASTGAVVETRYKPWGEVRYATANKTLPTRYTFTGLYSHMDDSATDLGAAGFGLMFYNARWYDPMTGRMIQADSIVPGGVQGLDRYAYTANNPVRFTDPSGHEFVCNSYADPECDPDYVDPWKPPQEWIDPANPMRRGGGWKFGNGHAGEDINADDYNDGLTDVVASTYGTVVSSNSCAEYPCEGSSASTMVVMETWLS